MLDIRDLEDVEVVFDASGEMRVNSEQGCLLRVGKIENLKIENKYHDKSRIVQKIKDIRYQMKCNDANMKNIHPERDGLAMHSGHSIEWMNIHINDRLQELESLLDIPVNSDIELIRSEYDSNYKKRSSKD